MIKKKIQNETQRTGSSPSERRHIESPVVSVLDDTDLLGPVAPLHTENTPQKWQKKKKKVADLLLQNIKLRRHCAFSIPP